MKMVLRRVRIFIAVVLALFALVVIGLRIGSGAVSSDISSVRVVISKGMTAGSIATELKDKGVIRSRFVFLITCRLSGAGNRLRPGVYSLNRAMALPEILKTLESGKVVEVWVTVPEGYTLRQIADALVAKNVISAPESFVMMAMDNRSDPSPNSYILGGSLEGYLFPDTYLVPHNADCESVLRMMLANFDKKVAIPMRDDIINVMRQRFSIGEDGFAAGLYRILTLASMVEREAKVPSDRSMIAGVMWNRLAKRMRLEVDATVSYVPGVSTNNKDRVLYSDLARDSAYNTYRHAGLPPGPICSPGLASIKAALHPAQTSALYYVARRDGSHVFSNTFEQHLHAVRLIRKGGK